MVGNNDGAASTAASSSSTSNGGHPDAQGAAPSATPELAQQQQQQSPSTSNAAAAAAAATATGQQQQTAAAGSEEAPAIPPATSLDGVPETKKYILADEWGYTAVGADLPEGTTPQLFAGMFPSRFFDFDAARAALSIALPLAVMAAGYGWLWYWHSICPLWQQLLCAIVIGTAYTGLFKVATECARFSFLPQAPVLQDSLGALIMAPSLYALHSWRLGHLHHLLHVNMLWEDTWGWHPLTKVQLAGAIIEGRKWTRAAWRVLLATPLKMLLGSLGHWLRHWDGCDLRRFEPNSRLAITISWAVPLLFAGFGLPAIAITGGASGGPGSALQAGRGAHGLCCGLGLKHTADRPGWLAGGWELDVAGDGYGVCLGCRRRGEEVAAPIRHWTALGTAAQRLRLVI